MTITLKLYNTLTNTKDEFKSIENGKVSIYTCGPTVYDFAHLGNFRAYIFDDLLRRYLEYRGYEVNHVMNITDVDDKTIRNSREQNIPLSEYTQKYTEYFFEDLDSLNCLRAHTLCKATEHIDDMVDMIQALLDKKYAYTGKDGSIYFNIAEYKDYGKLANLDLKGLKPGARVAQDEYDKESISDFALWKGWTEEDGDVYWDTPIGKGRPGWHIECSAMSVKYLGNPFDIHCGGVDLIFPHHENEIAQTQAATGNTFVNFWLHNEHLLVENRKMAKSAGNFYTLRDLMEKGFSPLAIRYALLSVHYRQQLNFTMENLEASEKAVKRFLNFITDLNRKPDAEKAPKVTDLILNAEAAFTEALDNDLNISEALGAVFDFIKEINKRALTSKQKTDVLSFINRLDSVLGIIPPRPSQADSAENEEIESLIEERNKARAEKDFARSDVIRDTLGKRGIILEDGSNGTTWKKE